jgi:non-homologous end joining protein Ku
MMASEREKQARSNNRTIEIERFVPRVQIDPRYHDTPYYIAPRDQVGQEASAVICEAMRGKEMVGMGRIPTHTGSRGSAITASSIAKQSCAARPR